MKLHTLQTNFITGQLDEATAARSESALYRNGAKALHNCEPFVTGGVRARRGSWFRQTLAGPAVLAEFSFNLDQSYCLVFTAGRMDAFDAHTGFGAGFVTGCPWTATILRELRFAQLGDVMWIVHPTFWPIEITRTGASSWTQAPMVFDGPLGTPTFRYAAASIAALAGGGQVATLTLASNPTVGGSPLKLVPGLLGQARLTAGPGPWLPFTVLTVAGLALGIGWADASLAAGAGMDVQFDSASAPGTGGTAGGGGATSGYIPDSGGGAEGAGATDGPDSSSPDGGEGGGGGGAP